MKKRDNKSSFWKIWKSRGVIGYIRNLIRHRRERRQLQYILKMNTSQPAHYNIDNPKIDTNGTKTVIVMVDGKFTCGLSDRLQGTAFAYSCIRELREEGVDVEFRINFTAPFNLSTYLEPASYNWQIAPDKISYNSLQAHELVLMYPEEKDKVPHRDISLTNAEYLKREIKDSSHSQIHIYTNIHYGKNNSHSISFNELFKPSARLQEILTPHIEFLNTRGEYLNTTFRFQNLLGDFKEGSYLSLESNEEREDLIKRCLAQIEKIHIKNPDKTILVTSDSRTFLNIANQKEYVYIVDGELVHMAYTTENTFEMHQKAFIDYLMIAGAEKIYLMRTGKMYNSGFPHTASMINNRPFERIEF